MKKQPTIIAALVAAVLASAGGAAFLNHHPKPTLREVFNSCEAGELSGLACCEDLNQVHDISSMTTILAECGQISAAAADPFGVRTKEEDDWDKKLAMENSR
jgi:hypothetical protein